MFFSSMQYIKGISEILDSCKHKIQSFLQQNVTLMDLKKILTVKICKMKRANCFSDKLFV